NIRIDPCSCRWHEFGSIRRWPARRQDKQAAEYTAALSAIRLAACFMALFRTVAQRSGLQRQKELTNDCILAVGIKSIIRRSLALRIKKRIKKAGNPYVMDFPARLPLVCYQAVYDILACYLGHC